MPNRIKTNIRKATTFASGLMDAIKEVMCLFMLGTALMDRRGLSTLRVRRDFIFGMPGMFSKSPTTTTIKSNQFHPSLR